MELPSKTYSVKTGCGKFYMTIVSNGCTIAKVIVHAGKAGGCASAHLANLSELLSNLYENGTKDERLQALASMSSTKCHMPDNCISEFAKILMDEETRRRCK